MKKLLIVLLFSIGIVQAGQKSVRGAQRQDSWQYALAAAQQLDWAIEDLTFEPSDQPEEAPPEEMSPKEIQFILTSAPDQSLIPASAPKKQQLSCPHCPKKFKQTSNLKTHIRTVHEQRKDFGCPHCFKAFGQNGGLQRHIRTIHEQRKDFQCPDCPKQYGENSSLQRHTRRQHPEILKRAKE
jgi:uncharacterized Zn-finger protein